jgi:hypothetical protein
VVECIVQGDASPAEEVDEDLEDAGAGNPVYNDSDSDMDPATMQRVIMQLRQLEDRGGNGAFPGGPSRLRTQLFSCDVHVLS